MIRAPPTMRSNGTWLAPHTTTSAGSSPSNAFISSSLMSWVMASAGIRGGPVHQHQLAAVLEGNSRVRRQPTDSLQDEISERVARHPHALDPLALVVAARMEPGRIERRNGAVGQPLHHHRPRGGQPAPGLDGLGTREHEVPGDEELVKAPSLSGRQDGAERVEVAVDIGEAEEEHRG